MNLYSYVENNPLKYTDPSGKQLAQAAVVASFADPFTVFLAVGALTAAEVAAVRATQTQQPLDPGTFQTGTVQEPGRGFGFMLPPQQSPDEPPNGGGWWKGPGYVATGVLVAAETVHETYSGIKDTVTDWKRKLANYFNPGVAGTTAATINTGSPSGYYISRGASYIPTLTYPVSNNVYSSNLQARTQAVQQYNAGSGASAPQNQLWVTPNGAVITWGGTIVAPAPASGRK